MPVDLKWGRRSVIDKIKIRPDEWKANWIVCWVDLEVVQPYTLVCNQTIVPIQMVVPTGLVNQIEWILYDFDWELMIGELVSSSSAK